MCSPGPTSATRERRWRSPRPFRSAMRRPELPSHGQYRSGARELEAAHVGISTRSVDAGHWRLRAQAEFTAAHDSADTAETSVTWWLNLAAVIEAVDGSLTYWAAHHAGARPDFHDRASFCVPLRMDRAATPPRAAGP